MHPFPASGLLAQYRPYILSEARAYTQRYFPGRYGMFEDVLGEALRLAEIAEQRFDPARGYAFPSFLHWHLRGLHRFCQKMWRQERSGCTFWEKDGRTVADVQQEGMYRRRGGARRATLPMIYWRLDRRCLRVNWREQRPALLNLDQWQGNSLRMTEKAVLDWMIAPDNRNLKQVAEWIGISKGYASKIRYRLLYKVQHRMWQNGATVSSD